MTDADISGAIPNEQPGLGSARRRPLPPCARLSRAGAQVSPRDLRRPDRPGGHGPHHLERVRDRARAAGLDPHRRPRRRQDHDRAHPRPRAELRTAGRLGEGTDHPHAGHGPALPGHHGKPAHRHPGNGRGVAHRHRRRAPDHRRRALRALQRPLQGLHHRRGPHALGEGVQRLPEDARGAAGARQVRVRHHRDSQGACHRAVALPALRPAPRRGRRADDASVEHCGQRRRRGRARSARPDRAGRGGLGARFAVAARPGHRPRGRPRRAEDVRQMLGLADRTASSTCSGAR